jgi:hypothetical protein
VVLNSGGNKKKSVVVLPEERGYMEEECGYIAGRAQLYCQKSAVILPEERSYIFVTKIVATKVLTAGAHTPLGPIYFIHCMHSIVNTVCYGFGHEIGYCIGYVIDNTIGYSFVMLLAI